MSSFRASEYGIEWPTDPTEIVQEALRDYVGDGDGADEAILDAHDTQVAVGALRRAADAAFKDKSIQGLQRTVIGTWLRAHANRLDTAS